jgi:hypothetical protein
MSFDPKKSAADLGLPVLLAVLVVVVWALSGVLIYYYAGAGRGIFGDMFGAANALFSGLAFAGVLYAILLQRADLKLQRNEHELSRAEMAAQREQLIAQNETLRLQSFENTFFQLLRLHNDIVNSIDLVRVGTGVVTAKGRDCFRVFYSHFRKKWEDDDEEVEAGDALAHLQKIKRSYRRFYPSIEPESGHYFLSLYNMVKFVDGSEVENKKRYTNLIRAQLSSFELLMLFYGCLGEQSGEKFKVLVERYALLKMLRREELLDPSHSGLYHRSAFNLGLAPGAITSS